MKKVLIISYYWPPSGGPGVQRWLNFVKYLPQNGIKPIVYIPQNPTYPIVDNNLITETPKEVTILKQPIFEPYGIAKKLSASATNTMSKGILPKEKKQTFLQQFLLWVRGNLFIPDARKFWITPSVKFLSTYIKENNIDTIITTGPPHSLHLIGWQLKKKLNTTWVADFRDPWTTIGYHKKLKLSNWTKNRHLQLEQQVLDDSDQIIVTSWGTKREFSSKTVTPIEVITNGFEPVLLPKVNLDSKFTISHIGSLLSERNPKVLWEVLEELIRENALFSKYFQLNLAGVVSEHIIENIELYNLKKNINLLGYISHTEALQLQRKSQVLLLIEIDSELTKAIIPGKLFEYLQAKRPILGIGPEGADFSIILKQTNAGVFFKYNQKAALKKQLSYYFEEYLNQNLNCYSTGIKKYTREALTKQLAKVLEK